MCVELEQSFGNYLRQLRKTKRITLTELAGMTSVSQPHLSHIETGFRGVPSPQVLRKLSKSLGVSYIGMLIKAGHLTEEEVITCNKCGEKVI